MKSIDFKYRVYFHRSQDIGGAIRHVAKMQDHSVMVDLLGAIIEKP